MRLSSVRVATATPGRRAGIDAAQHEGRQHGEDEAAADIDEAVDEHRRVLDVVAEVCDRFAGGAHRLAGLGPTARELGGEHVGAQEGLHVHPRAGPHQRSRVDGDHSQHVGEQRRGREPVHPGMVAGLQRMEAAAEQPATQHREGEEHHEEQPPQPERARSMLGHAPCEAPHSWLRAHAVSSSASASNWWKRPLVSAASASRVPCSTTMPWSSTTISSTCRRVLSR